MENLKTRELANFHYISLTDKGNVRENNEDYLGYFDTVNGHVFFLLCGVIYPEVQLLYLQ